MLVHVALDEQRADVGVEPGREQPSGGLERPGPELFGVVVDRDGVQVDDAVEGVGAVLVGDPLAESAEVVADVQARPTVAPPRRRVPSVQDTGRSLRRSS